MVGFIEGLLSATITATSPLLLACLGEIISEKGGVLNLGIEGIMLFGALSGFVVTGVTGSPWLGFFVAIVVGIAVSAIHAFLSISLKADQVISGIMLSLLGIGLTSFLGNEWVGRSVNTFDQVLLPVVGRFLVEIPVIGPAAFRNPPTDFVAFALVPVVWYFLFRTNLGLEIAAVGEDPETADAAGVNVSSRRYIAVLIGGAFAGAAGAHLSLAFAQLWAAEMVAGRGWIAIALVIFVQWRPLRSVFGALLFGLVSAFVIRSQSVDLVGILSAGSEVLASVFNVAFNPTVMPMYPYIVTIIILTYISRKAMIQEIGAPAALLQPYIRESE
jgi:simple sugar transport system permease protein